MSNEKPLSLFKQYHKIFPSESYKFGAINYAQTNSLKTAEFVSPMHPDKICDRIADSILDECLKQDPDSRVAVEVLGGHKKIVVMGEITTNAKIDIKEIVKKEINNPEFEISTNITTQSNEIAKGVNIGGAGDQGIMIGYACNENEEMVPLEYYYARSLCRFIYEKYPYDGKTQVTINTENKTIHQVVASFQNVTKNQLREVLKDWINQEKIKELSHIGLFLNSAGDWTVGGFDADTGLTGRKIVVDSYGPRIPVGGGSFSGKDPTKVDRSGALMARRIAVQILKKTQCKEVMVKVSYAIGNPDPLNVCISALPENEKYWYIVFDGDISNSFMPSYIIKGLDLKKPQYRELSMWGHFGNNNIWDK